MKGKIHTGMPVYHHRRRCYGIVLYEVAENSNEYQTGRTKSGRQWKVFWTRHDDADRHSKQISVHQEHNLTPLN